MAAFRYKAVNRSGAMDAGTIEAADERAAQRSLRSRGLTPLQVVPTSGVAVGDSTGAPSSLQVSKQFPGAGTSLFGGSTAQVTRKDVLRFTSELSVLLKAGLPLDRAIKVQIDSAPEGAMKALLSALLDSLKGGKALSVGLETRTDVFDSFYINMVRSGEASGSLATVLAELAAYLERSRAIRASVVSALIYPAILAAVAIISIFVMLGFVVPEFEALFEDMGDALPLLTEMVIGLGDVIAAWGWLLLLLGIGGWFLMRRWLATDEGQQWRDRRSLALPVLGGIVNRYEVAQFSRTMGTLLSNGVSMLKAADIAIGTVRNSLVRDALQVIAPAIKRGGRMSESMDASVFSPVAVQMVRVGEESGSLDDMLLQLAQVYENEVEAEIKRALTLLEPILILGMGGVIAVIIVAILMGILSVNQLAV
ncbi:MAG: type II secretion system F family protein [Halieaceae bacterium]|jgi:general secretion pathway protein F|nr:type II secretion system F family protein [Halieaceae bacterium]